MIARDAIVAEARSWIGTRYRHQGRAKHIGVDCIGLIGMTALACGVQGAAAWRNDQNMHNYGRTPDPQYLRAACMRFLTEIAIDAVRPGDVLVIAFPRQPQHFALIRSLEPMMVLHAYLQRRKVCEQSLPIAGSRVLSAHSLQGVD